jgi:hypothetical protein
MFVLQAETRSPTPYLRIARRLENDSYVAHPLKAIGIVATIIVFGSAMLVKEAWTVL